MSKFGNTLLDIGSALPLVGGIIGGIQSRQNTSDTIEANKQLAEYQYSKDLEMWERGNAYNSPSAQMARLKEAGLNPNLVYGNGATGNMATQLPKYQAPTADFSGRTSWANPMETLSTYQDIRLKQSQLDSMEEQRNLLRRQSWIKEAEGVYADDFFRRRTNLQKQAQDQGIYKTSILSERDLQERYKSMAAPYQLEFQKGRVDQQELAMSKLFQDTELVKKKNDYFVAEAIANIGGRFAQGLRAIFPAARKAAMPSFRQNARRLPGKSPFHYGYKNYKRRNP